MAIEVRARPAEVNEEAATVELGSDDGVSHHSESVYVILSSHACFNDLVLEFAKHALVAEPGLRGAGLIPDKEPFVVFLGLVDLMNEPLHVDGFPCCDIDSCSHFAVAGFLVEVDVQIRL